MISTCAHTKTRSSTSVTPPSPNRPGQRVRHRRPARGPLVEAERDPRRVPQQQRRDDARRSWPGSGRPRRGGCPRSACGRWILRMPTRPRSRRAARAPRTRRPSARTSPGGRATAAWRRGSTAPIIAMTIVGKRTTKPQKIAACIRPGPEPLEQLALAQHDLGLVAHARAARRRCGRPACRAGRGRRAASRGARTARRRRRARPRARALRRATSMPNGPFSARR